MAVNCTRIYELPKVEAECGSIPMVLVQNKIDLLERAVMTTEEGNAKAEKVKLQFYRTSVQDNYHASVTL